MGILDRMKAMINEKGKKLVNLSPLLSINYKKLKKYV